MKSPAIHRPTTTTITVRRHWREGRNWGENQTRAGHEGYAPQRVTEVS
jgi:hypothetical protein